MADNPVMARQRVHFVNRYFHPDHSATSQLLSDLAFHLASRGWEVLVTTSRQRYDDPSAQLPSTETVNGIAVHRCFSSSFGRSNLIGRSVDYATFYVSALASLLRRCRRGDVIVAMTDPPLISVIAAFAAMLRGALLVNWVQDLFPEIAEAAGIRGARLARGIRNWSIRRARRNVALSDGMAASIARLGANAIVQHNWAQPGIRPVDRADNPLRSEWKVGEEVIVEYSGNLGRAHDVATVGDAIQRAPSQRFVFIGGGSGMDQLEALTAGSPNVTFLGYQSRERLAESLSAGDIHLVTLLPPFDGLIAPSKIYGIMAAGRPIVFVGNPQGDAAGILLRHDCGIAVATGDGAALAATLQRLREDAELRQRLGTNGRQAFEREYTMTHSLKRWESILKEAADEAT